MNGISVLTYPTACPVLTLQFFLSFSIVTMYTLSDSLGPYIAMFYAPWAEGYYDRKEQVGNIRTVSTDENTKPYS